MSPQLKLSSVKTVGDKVEPAILVWCHVNDILQSYFTLGFVQLTVFVHDDISMGLKEALFRALDFTTFLL